jgi:prephenate dehydrogenase
MTVQITIIGLGQIGASIGLALRGHNLDIRVIGHDKVIETAKEAQKLGAVDDVKYNLPASVREAKIIILALPFSGVKETLQIIAPDLQEGTLVFDTAPSKATVAAWAKELIPAGRFYVGLAPAINPEYLHGAEYGIQAARADLFDRGLFVVDIPVGTPENVFELTLGLVSLFGATPLMMDSAEADGLFANIDMLPQLAASALVDATVDQPGWLEARKLAGRPYASVTSVLASHDEASSLADSTLENRQNVVRVLNGYITSLLKLRDAIEDGDRDALVQQLEANHKGRLRWIRERHAADWLQRDAAPTNVPNFKDRMNQMFFGSMMSERAKPRK